jgi:flavin-dependent dehydrogenase
VGDAGCHKDPFSALGICDALRDADLLAGAVDEGLSGRRPLEEALAGYEQQRNEATMPEYQVNVAMAELKGAPPEFYALRAALRGSQEDTNSFYLAFQGMIAQESFFNPENMGRIMARGGS